MMHVSLFVHSFIPSSWHVPLNAYDNSLLYRNVVLAFDEMKIHEGLVFNSETGSIVGFVDTGDMNSRIKSFEAHVLGKEEGAREVASLMLALCVRGIFVKLDYLIGQFPTSSKLYFSSVH